LLGGYGNNTAALLLAGALLSTVAMMAALIPARSAMNVEPMVALRNE
jgi:ABC-type lipoprotein release transport system permease subunit